MPRKGKERHQEGRVPRPIPPPYQVSQRYDVKREMLLLIPSISETEPFHGNTKKVYDVAVGALFYIHVCVP